MSHALISHHGVLYCESFHCIFISCLTVVVVVLTVDKLFRDAGVQSGGQVRYDDIIKVLLTPLPDY